MVGVVTAVSCSFEETYQLGASFGRQAQPNSIWLLYGDLGAGKTAFIKGFTAGFLENNDLEVSSPTFTYLNIYTSKERGTVYHFDLYRLTGAEEFLSMGFDESFDAGGVCCIEWAEKIASLPLPHAIQVHIQHAGQDKRSISVTFP